MGVLRNGVATLALALFAAGCASTDAASDRRSAGTSGISDASAEGLSPAMTRYVDATLAPSPADAPTDGPGLDDFRARLATLEARIAELQATANGGGNAASAASGDPMIEDPFGVLSPAADGHVAKAAVHDEGDFRIALPTERGELDLYLTPNKDRVNPGPETARSRNAQVRAARQELEAARQAMPQAAALDAVLAQYQAFARELDTGAGPQRQKGMVAMQFPFHDTSALRSELAALDVTLAEQELRRVWHEVHTAIRTRRAEFMYVDAATLLNTQAQALLEQQLKVSQSQLASGSGGSPTVLATQMRIGRLADTGKALMDRRVALRTQLAELYGNRANWIPELPEGLPEIQEPAKTDATIRNAMSSGQTGRDPALPAVETYFSVASQPAVQAVVADAAARRTENATGPTWTELPAPVAARLAGRPVVARMRLMVERLTTMREMTVRMATPDPTRGTAYLETGARRSSGTEAEADAMAAPFMLRRDLDPAQAGRYPTQQAYVAELDRRIAAAQERLLAAERASHAEWFARVEALDAAQRRETLTRDTLLPQVRQAWDNALDAYRHARLDLPTLLDVQQRYQDIQLEYYAALRDGMIAQARLEELIAAPLETLKLPTSNDTPKESQK